MKYLLLILLLSCGSSKESELKNSKKLIIQGHKTLYNNGAFKLPHSSVKLIPAGPEVFNLSSQLVKGGAKDAFFLSLSKAKESYHIIKKGSLKSYQVSKKGAQAWANMTNQIKKNTRKNSVWLIKKSSATSLGIIKKGYAQSVKHTEKLIKAANEMPYKSFLASQKFAKHIEIKRREYELKMDNRLEKIDNTRKSGTTFKKGKDDFVLGYIGLGRNIKGAYNKLGSQKTFEKFKSETTKASKVRSKWSNYSLGIIKNSILNYSKNVSTSFGKAVKELKQNDEYGVTFSLFKSLVWVLDASIWQAVLKPAGNIVAGSFGYIVTNGVVYPVMSIGAGTKATVNYIIEYTKFAGESTYHVFAPSFKLAIASILSSGQAVLEHSSYGASKVAKTVGSVGHKTTGAIGKKIIQVSGYGGKVITKMAVVPITFFGSNIVHATSGVVLGSAGVGAGTVYAVKGEAVNLSSGIVQASVIATGTTVGTAASTVYGTGVMLYHGASSIIVPSTYTLSSGLVMTYGMLAQISSHTILMMGDVSYVVLSLEGPKWVLYGIKGKVDKKDHPSGTIIDLKKLQEQGEEIRKVPLSDEEVKKLFKE